MIELTLVTLVLLFVVFVVKPGRTPPLANPMVIHRLGQYHITLAPLLNLAQPLIEDIAKRLGNPDDPAQNSRTLYFEVSDPEVTAHGKNYYLLAITRLNGILYFQAITSGSEDTTAQVAELREFANKTLLNFPASGEIDETLSTQIVSATHEVAQWHNAIISAI